MHFKGQTHAQLRHNETQEGKPTLHRCETFAKTYLIGHQSRLHNREFWGKETVSLQQRSPDWCGSYNNESRWRLDSVAVFQSHTAGKAWRGPVISSAERECDAFSWLVHTLIKCLIESFAFSLLNTTYVDKTNSNKHDHIWGSVVLTSLQLSISPIVTNNKRQTNYSKSSCLNNATQHERSWINAYGPSL